MSFYVVLFAILSFPASLILHSLQQNAEKEKMSKMTEEERKEYKKKKQEAYYDDRASAEAGAFQSLSSEEKCAIGYSEYCPNDGKCSH